MMETSSSSLFSAILLRFAHLSSRPALLVRVCGAARFARVLLESGAGRARTLTKSARLAKKRAGSGMGELHVVDELQDLNLGERAAHEGQPAQRLGHAQAEQLVLAVDEARARAAGARRSRAPVVAAVPRPWQSMNSQRVDEEKRDGKGDTRIKRARFFLSHRRRVLVARSIHAHRQ